MPCWLLLALHTYTSVLMWHMGIPEVCCISSYVFLASYALGVRVNCADVLLIMMYNVRPIRYQVSEILFNLGNQ